MNIIEGLVYKRELTDPDNPKHQKFHERMCNVATFINTILDKYRDQIDLSINIPFFISVKSGYNEQNHPEFNEVIPCPVSKEMLNLVDFILKPASEKKGYRATKKELDIIKQLSLYENLFRAATITRGEINLSIASFDQPKKPINIIDISKNIFPMDIHIYTI